MRPYLYLDPKKGLQLFTKGPLVPLDMKFSTKRAGWGQCSEGSLGWGSSGSPSQWRALGPRGAEHPCHAGHVQDVLAMLRTCSGHAQDMLAMLRTFWPCSLWALPAPKDMAPLHWFLGVSDSRPAHLGWSCSVAAARLQAHALGSK